MFEWPAEDVLKNKTATIRFRCKEDGKVRKLVLPPAELKALFYDLVELIDDMTISNDGDNSSLLMDVELSLQEE